mgnify:CR=1 FL=1
MADVTIPEYAGIRSVVEDTYDPTRRAGSGGQRYFTDMQYVPVPSFRGDRWMYDAQNYLAANPDIKNYYETNEEALIAGGDPRFETPEGYAKWHYETVGKWEPNRPLVPTHTQAGEAVASPLQAAQAAAENAALVYRTQNANNPARQGLASLHRVSDEIINKDMATIKESGASERDKIGQVRGYMDQYAVSPYRLSEATNTSVQPINEYLHPYYQTKAEQKQYGLPHSQIQTTLDKLIEQSAPTFNQGGITTIPAARRMYLGGTTDGMADRIPATINGGEPARLSDGEFVVPADVVSHLGNGNSDAGAQQLYGMMDRVREARTGRTEQGREINPHNFLA